MNTPLYKSLRFKLVFFAFLIEAIMLSLLLFNSQKIMNAYLIDQTDKQLELLKESFNIALAQPLITRDYATLQSIIDGWVKSSELVYMRIEKDGSILANATAPNGYPDGEYIRQESMMLELQGQRLGVLLFGYDTSFLDRAKEDLFSEGIIIAFIELILSAILLLTVGIWLSKNLKELIKASDSISEGNFNINIKSLHDDEVGALGRSFNKMSLAIKTREQELKDINANLNKIVEEKINAARKKDEIIYEQSKNSALSELLVNIAHQWRQPLNVVSLGLANIEDELNSNNTDKKTIEKDMERIQTELENISSTITYFTSIYKSGGDKRESCKVKELIDTCINAIKTITINHIEIENKIDDILEINSDKNCFLQAFIPIFNNANEIVTARNIDNPKISINAFLKEGRIIIEISDNFGGIEKDIIKTIFDPYTTSNFKSRNKGLGLFSSKTLIEQRLCGEIFVENTPNGAKFTIVLPA